MSAWGCGRRWRSRTARRQRCGTRRITARDSPPSTAAANRGSPGDDEARQVSGMWKITLGELDRKLGIEILSESAQKVAARMPVAGNTQSLGRLHGGATAALAEALGSWAARIHASTMGEVCGGGGLNTTPLHNEQEGVVA